MRKLTIKDSEIMKIAIQQEILRSDESRYDHRLHGVLLVCAGKNCYEVADLLGHSPRTIQYWVEQFEEAGFIGLADGERPGRPARLNEKIRKSIDTELRQNPRDLGYTQNLWDGKLLSHHLSTAYNITLGVRQCQRLFRDLGFRHRKPRPLIAESDPESKKTYKKNSAA